MRTSAAVKVVFGSPGLCQGRADVVQDVRLADPPPGRAGIDEVLGLEAVVHRRVVARGAGQEVLEQLRELRGGGRRRRRAGRRRECEHQREDRDQHAPTLSQGSEELRNAKPLGRLAHLVRAGTEQYPTFRRQRSGRAPCRPVSAEDTCSPARTARPGSQSSPLPRARDGSAGRVAGAPSTCRRSAVRRRVPSSAGCGRSRAAYLSPIASAPAPCATS